VFVCGATIYEVQHVDDVFALSPTSRAPNLFLTSSWGLRPQAFMLTPAPQAKEITC